MIKILVNFVGSCNYICYDTIADSYGFDLRPVAIEDYQLGPAVMLKDLKRIYHD